MKNAYRITLSLLAAILSAGACTVAEENFIVDNGNRAAVEITVNCPANDAEPTRTDITGLLRRGANVLEIDVTNLWVNRLAGDEREPEDIRYNDSAGGSRMGGSLMLEVPDWLREGRPRPSQGRKTVVSYKIIRADTPLLPSGLLGPVSVERIAE